jgi:DNA-binding transcriptional MerR regulator
MYIGKAAQLSGTTIKSIRHYEAIGLLPSPQRQGKYRIYSQHSVEWLKLIKCAQQLSSSLRKCSRLSRTTQATLAVEVVSNAIEVKKNAVARQIEALQQVQAQLEFETRFKDASQPVNPGCDP